jgi:hypothetical protein
MRRRDASLALVEDPRTGLGRLHQSRLVEDLHVMRNRGLGEFDALFHVRGGHRPLLAGLPRRSRRIFRRVGSAIARKAMLSLSVAAFILFCIVEAEPIRGQRESLIHNC